MSSRGDESILSWYDLDETTRCCTLFCQISRSNCNQQGMILSGGNPYPTLGIYVLSKERKKIAIKRTLKSYHQLGFFPT